MAKETNESIIKRLIHTSVDECKNSLPHYDKPSLLCDLLLECHRRGHTSKEQLVRRSVSGGILLAVVRLHLLRTMMKILNLYAGLGGNRKHWTDCQVTAIENNEKIAAVYRQLHPNDEVVVGCASDYLLEHYKEFDFIWSSPPCQTHSKVNKWIRHSKRYPDMTLYQQIIFLQHFFVGPWVVENVKPYYEPLIPAKEVGRHLFWSNFDFEAEEVPGPAGFIKNCNVAGAEALKEWLGIHYEGQVYYNKCPAQVLRNCVHPDLGLQIYTAARDAA